MIAGLSSQLVDAITQHSVYAVFVLMAVDALLPVGGELIMVYAGVVAAGAVSGHHATLFGILLAGGTESYVVLAVAGSLGYLAGALVGWGIGARGGRPLIDRHGVFASPLGSYTLLTLLGSMLWCFGFAAVGWALGGRWESFHHSFRYADYAAAALLVAVAVAVLAHRRRAARAQQ